MCILHLKFVVSRNSMIGNPLKQLKFQCVTEINLCLKTSLCTRIAHMWLIWYLRWREEVGRNSAWTSQWTSDARGQGRVLSPEERPAIGVGMRGSGRLLPGQSWAFFFI